MVRQKETCAVTTGGRSGVEIVGRGKVGRREVER